MSSLVLSAQSTKEYNAQLPSDKDKPVDTTPGFTPPPATVPVDKGALLLVALGVGYAFFRLSRTNS